jgi:ketosteroid isomerase-like protein
MTQQEQKEHARKFIQNIHDRQPNVFADLITDNFEFEIMGRLPGLEPIRGKRVFMENFIPLVQRFLPNGMNFKFGAIFSEGPHVSIQGECDCTAANGKRYANRYHWYIRFEGDRIAQVREYNDTNHIREAVLS